jgi:hypothetical protein
MKKECIHARHNGNLKQALVALLHQALFVAGVRNPNWKGYLGKNHPLLFSRGCQRPRQEGGFVCKKESHDPKVEKGPEIPLLQQAKKTDRST